jgi:hypothetical protein
VNWRLVGGALVVLALAAGLVAALSLDGEGERAAPLRTEAAASITQAPPSAATDPPVTHSLAEVAPPVPPVADVTDAATIWAALLAHHNWAFQHPDEADLTRYLSERCTCFAPLQERLELLVANGWHEDDAGLVLDSLEVTEQTGDTISLAVHDRHVELRVVDETGTVVEQAPARALSRWHVDLALEVDGWRITRWDFAGAVAGS